ncbi:AAA family ATPase [Vibrio vulnificus]|uniref:AAA family ATPase n=1 Tax=Vibrio vulnificus TaxID=672 RepID=UPI0028C952C8|nr:AAA family ATPase [Vibrio vulnificus]
MYLKIEKISVEHLFGFLNYDIELPESENVVITGPNGYGKTMLLKLIHNALSNNYAELSQINFSTFELFTNLGRVRYLNSASGIQVESFLHDKKKIITHSAQQASEEKVFDGTREYSILIHSVHLNDESESYSIITKQRAFLEDKMKLAQTRLSKLDQLVEDLFSCISKKSQAFQNDQLPEMLQQRVIGLQATLATYTQFGLLPKSSKYLKSDLNLVSDSTINLKDKLAEIFYEESLNEDFVARLCMFSELIAKKKFSFKTLTISPEVGFAFYNHVGTNIPLHKLSSGEKNQVSIFFDLIFKAENGTLILIDEPEVSLHISWQRDLLNEFSQISRFNHYSQLIVTTHSPDVIGDDWENSVDLFDKHVIVKSN